MKNLGYEVRTIGIIVRIVRVARTGIENGVHELIHQRIETSLAIGVCSHILDRSFAIIGPILHLECVAAIVGYESLPIDDRLLGEERLRGLDSVF